MKWYEGIFGAAIAVVLATLFALYVRNKGRNTAKGKDSALAGACWLTVFVSGIVIQFAYHALFLREDLHTNWLYLIGDAIDKSICMFGFVFKSTDAVKTAYATGGVGIFYAVMIVVVYLCAGIWTQYVLISTFFKGIVNAFRVWCNRYRLFGENYIVFGCGQDVETFLRNLTKKRKIGFFRDKVTVVTGEPTDGKTADDYYKKYVKMGYAVIAGRADEDVFRRAGIRRSNRKTTIVALSASDEQNMAVAELIVREYERRWKKASVKTDAMSEDFVSTVGLEGRIGYSSIERTEHFDYFERVCGKINFTNLEEMRARKFFREHPVSETVREYIDVTRGRLRGKYENGILTKDDGTEYAITHVFVGFGRSNYQMLRASVEYGQILGVGYNAVVLSDDVSSAPDGEEASFHQAKLMQQAPALFGMAEQDPHKTYLEDPKEGYAVRFERADVFSGSFYQKIIRALERSDKAAVYIALGDDKLDVETALELRQAILKHGKKQNDVKIYAKVRNRSALSSETFLNADSVFPGMIACYGFDDETIDAEDIVGRTTDKLANILSNRSHDISWAKTPEFEKDSNRSKITYLRSELGFIGFDLEESDAPTEDGTNAAYRDAYAGGKRTDALPEDYLRDEAGKIVDEPRNNLARLEHLRWDAFYIVNGWTKKPVEDVGFGNGDDQAKWYFSDDAKARLAYIGRKNLSIHRHACITTVEGLTRLAKYQAYLKEESENGRLREDPYRAFTEDERVLRGETLAHEKDFSTLKYDFSLLDALPERLCNVRTYNAENPKERTKAYRLVRKAGAVPPPTDRKA